MGVTYPTLSAEAREQVHRQFSLAENRDLVLVDIKRAVRRRLARDALIDQALREIYEEDLAAWQGTPASGEGAHGSGG